MQEREKQQGAEKRRTREIKYYRQGMVITKSSYSYYDNAMQLLTTNCTYW